MVSTNCNFIRLDYTSNELIFLIIYKLQNVIAVHGVFRSSLKLDAPLGIWGPTTQGYRQVYGSWKWRILLYLAACEIHFHSLLKSSMENFDMLKVIFRKVITDCRCLLKNLTKQKKKPRGTPVWLCIFLVIKNTPLI